MQERVCHPLLVPLRRVVWEAESKNETLITWQLGTTKEESSLLICLTSKVTKRRSSKSSSCGTRLKITLETSLVICKIETVLARAVKVRQSRRTLQCRLAARLLRMLCTIRRTLSTWQVKTRRSVSTSSTTKKGSRTTTMLIQEITLETSESARTAVPSMLRATNPADSSQRCSKAMLTAHLGLAATCMLKAAVQLQLLESILINRCHAP